MIMATNDNSTIPRRTFLSTMCCAGALAAAPSISRAAAPRPGRLRQGVCKGVFKGLKLDLDDMCREAARLGAVGIDLVGPEAFPTLKKHGLIATMVGGGSGIRDGRSTPGCARPSRPRPRPAPRT
jgi:hypothetical protein